MTIASGTQGTCAWTIDDDGLLTIGTGTINATGTYDYWTWNDYRDQVTEIFIDAITLSGNIQYMFAYMPNCTDINCSSSINTSGVTKMSFCFYQSGFEQLTGLQYWNTGNVTEMLYAFSACSSLTDISALSSWDVSKVDAFTYMFRGCNGLTDISALSSWTIKSGLYSVREMFSYCTKLTSAAAIANWNIGAVEQMSSMFANCYKLAGNFSTNAKPQFYSDLFTNTQKDIFLVDIGAGNLTFLNAVASTYSNVHFEANDNPAPTLVSMTVTRVATNGSTTYDEQGTYAYINATANIYDTYIPVGWTNELGAKTLTVDGSASSPTWTESVTDNTYTLSAWVNVGDSAKHTFVLYVADSIKASGTVKRTSNSQSLTVILPMVSVPFDIYKGPTGFGIGIGSKVSDEIVYIAPDPYFAIDTAASPGTTDGDLYAAIVALGWDSDVII